MKIPKQLKSNINGKPISRKYMRLCAVYRRFAGRTENLDFSESALIECYDNETHGIKIQKYYGEEHHKNNGYTLGKWAKDISVASWIEDINSGYFAKVEFITPLNRWWSESALSVTEGGRFFPYVMMKDERL